jgi:hypothetical protein
VTIKLPPPNRHVNNKIKNVEKLDLIFEPKTQVAKIFFKKVRAVAVNRGGAELCWPGLGGRDTMRGKIAGERF